MIGFWVGGVFAVLLVLALLFRPFLLKSRDVNVSRRQLNAAIYRDQLVRLDRDRAENTLAEADYEQARAELQRRVIDDTAEADATSTLQAPKKTMLAVGLVLPIVAIGLYVLLGSPATLQPNGPQHAAGRDVEVTIRAEPEAVGMGQAADERAEVFPVNVIAFDATAAVHGHKQVCRSRGSRGAAEGNEENRTRPGIVHAFHLEVGGLWQRL